MCKKTRRLDISGSGNTPNTTQPLIYRGYRLEKGDGLRPPARHQSMFNIKVVEYAGNHKVDDVIQRFRVLVEARVGGEDGYPQARQLEGVFQMDGGEWGFAMHQYQFALLFDGDIGGALHQITAAAVGGSGEEGAGTGTDNHGAGRTTTAGDG